MMIEEQSNAAPSPDLTPEAPGETVRLDNGLPWVPLDDGAGVDPRHIVHGDPIPCRRYADQPYIVKTGDGAWLCCLTTGRGEEGQPGQHIVTMRSFDRGRSWEDMVQVEPPDGPQASYAVMHKVPSGRVYIFYNHNTDRITEFRQSAEPFVCRRCDSLGHFVFKYSDDHGRSWSPRRYEIPIRRTSIDEANAFGGDTLMFWNVGKPFEHDGALLVPLHKVTGMGTRRSEGFFLRSPNALTEPDVGQLDWETLPEGDTGLKAPEGPISEEQSVAILSDGTLFCTYRTVMGYAACAVSRDGARTWTSPDVLRYADGRPVKNPRAANFIWGCRNGRYLYWFHNHSGRDFRDRNPVWIAMAEECRDAEGLTLRFSQPEILLYDDDPMVRMSYPDLVEEEGGLYVTETQKNEARVHRIPSRITDVLFRQFEICEICEHGLRLQLTAPVPASVPAPRLPLFSVRDRRRSDYGELSLRQGVSLEIAFAMPEQPGNPHAILVDNRTPDGRGLAVARRDESLTLILNDGRGEAVWHTEPGVLHAGDDNHVTVLVDAGPRVILFVVNGQLLDGGTYRQFGWGVFNPHLRGVDGGDDLHIGSEDHPVEMFRLYNRSLRVSEAIGNWRFWRQSRTVDRHKG